MPPGARMPAREAGAELMCLQAWEQHAGWIVEHTAKWPKSARFSLVQKVDNHALAVLELLVVARYEPKQRSAALREANRFLPRNRRDVIDGFTARESIIREGYPGMLQSAPGTSRLPFEITFETPQRSPLDRQVAALVAALESILTGYRGLQAIAQGI